MFGFSTVALAFLAACGAALSEGRATESAPPAPPSAAAPSPPPASDVADAGSAADAGCPRGSVLDGHSGLVRCLEADELDGGADAGVAPDGGAVPPADAGADADAAAPPDAAVAAPTVTVAAPVFEGGDVPKLDKVLAKLTNDVGRCVVDAGGLTGKSARLELTFLVRARGRAEGVEVKRVKGVAESAGACVQKVLKNRRVGTPTEDPVGVTVTFELAP